MFSNTTKAATDARSVSNDLIQPKHPRHMVTIKKTVGPAQVRPFGGWTSRHLEAC
ncbi:hypothetical protein J3E69DRAFT_331915, partial [Trichoderma sp. SZMC 28015]